MNGDPVNFADPTGLDKSGINPDPDGKAIGPPPSTVIVLIPGNNGPIGLPPGMGFLPPGGTYVPGGIGGSPSGGGGDKGDGPPTSPEGKGNPNCIMNAVSGATGLARPFGNVGPTGSIGHDGIHVVAPSGSQVTTLSPLAGTVLGIHDGGDGTTIVDVKLDRGGFVALYKDLVTVNVRRGQHLGGGATVGTVGAYEGGGLHFALLNGGREADKYYRSLTSTGQTKKIVVGMFTNPNGPNSPVNCPGVPVNNAGVNPHP